jgi:hypothetical protein
MQMTTSTSRFILLSLERLTEQIILNRGHRPSNEARLHEILISPLVRFWGHRKLQITDPS